MTAPIRSVSRGALVGAGASIVVALGDYGAAWMWQPLFRDRVSLLWRMFAIHVPIGAIVGALICAIALGAGGPLARVSARIAHGDSERTHLWRRRLFPAPFVALAGPLLAWVAHLLFTGGSASRLPARSALVAIAALGLVAGLYVAVRLGRVVFERARDLRPARGRVVALALLALQFLIGKVDQTFYPKLYGYLHACLAAAGWLVAALAVAVAAMHLPRLRRLEERLGARALLGLAPLAALLAFALGTLDGDQNVRVALFDPRAASSRSLMQGLETVLSGTSTGASAEAIERARRERERLRAALRADGLPVAADAHVLLVTIDALRADHLGTYGYERGLSPNLDRLASEAVVFERAYAAAPHSSYSLCSLMTSEYVHETVDLGLPLPDATLPRALAEAGYQTAGFYTLGIFHTEGERLSKYRDDAFGLALHDHSDTTAEAKTDEVLDEVDRIVARGEPPSFLWVHYFDVHEPYDDRSLGDSDIDRYDGEIRIADRAFGRLLSEVERRFQRDVVVVVSADHGEEFRDHGGVYHGSSLYEEQIRVPLIVRAPGLAPRRVVAPVETVDIAPTVLALAGVPAPRTMRGDDLRALAVGRIDTMGPAFAAVTHKRMAVRWPYKLIADLRFNLYELYDLAADPRERTNLAGSRPELLDELRGEVYAWLDSLRAAGEADGRRDPHVAALDLGRLGDRRSVEPLAALIADESAPIDARREAGRILGRLADPRSADMLVRAMSSREPLVAAEAAIALGRMYDARAKDALRELVFSEDPDLRVRSAVSLGRLRDPAAVPGLVDALRIADERYEREEAVRWLGRLHDGRAVEPLIALIPEFRLRHLIVIALGDIGDARALPTLLDMLDWEHHTNIRDNVVRALGQLADPRARERIVAVAASEPDSKSAGESLVRLGTIEAGLVGGTDVSPASTGHRGLAACRAGPLRHDWEYLQRTTCETRGRRATLRLVVPPAIADATDGATAILRARRADTGDAVAVRVALGDTPLDPVRIDGQWSEYRWPIPAGSLRAGALRASIEVDDAATRLSLDHFLLVPRPPTVAAATATAP